MRCYHCQGNIRDTEYIVVVRHNRTYLFHHWCYTHPRLSEEEVKRRQLEAERIYGGMFP